MKRSQGLISKHLRQSVGVASLQVVQHVQPIFNYLKCTAISWAMGGSSATTVLEKRQKLIVDSQSLREGAMIQGEPGFCIS